MVHREGEGTLIIDRRFKGIGRIKRASGINDPKTFKKMLARFTELADDVRGRELLRAMKRKLITPIDLYEAARSGDFSKLPSVDALQKLTPAWNAWLARTAYSADHHRNLKKELRRFERARPELAVNDLPGVLLELRISMAKTPRSFNYARAAALAFVRQMVTRSNPLYVAIWGIDPLSAPTQRVAPDLTIADVETYGHEAIEMALTGMLPKEYWSRDYSAAGGVLKIHGTKREGRDRRIPLMQPIEGPRVSLMTFRRRVRKLSDFAVQTKDFRNFFSWLLEEAEIPRTRRRLYMGHGKKDTTDIYEEREVRRFLADDGAKIKAKLAELRAIAKAESEKKIPATTVSSTVAGHIGLPHTA